MPNQARYTAIPAETLRKRAIDLIRQQRPGVIVTANDAKKVKARQIEWAFRTLAPSKAAGYLITVIEATKQKRLPRLKVTQGRSNLKLTKPPLQLTLL